DRVLGQHHAHQDLADHGAVAVRDQQPVVRPDEGKERARRLVGDDFLLLRRALDGLGMGGVAADRDDEGTRHAYERRYTASAASAAAPRARRKRSAARTVSSAESVQSTASARAL